MLFGEGRRRRKTKQLMTLDWKKHLMIFYTFKLFKNFERQPINSFRALMSSDTIFLVEAYLQRN